MPRLDFSEKKKKKKKPSAAVVIGALSVRKLIYFAVCRYEGFGCPSVCSDSWCDVRDSGQV